MEFFLYLLGGVVAVWICLAFLALLSWISDKLGDAAELVGVSILFGCILGAVVWAITHVPATPPTKAPAAQEEQAF
jgi:hypothetical protein